MRTIPMLMLALLTACGSPPGGPGEPEPEPAATAPSERAAPDEDAGPDDGAEPGDDETIPVRREIPEDAESPPPGDAPETPPMTTEPKVTVASLYSACRDRVEEPEADGECSSDDDCMATGCSREMCVTTAAAEGIMSTCEDRRCFDVLDACGCVEGRCTWSLKDHVPPVETLKLAPK